MASTPMATEPPAMGITPMRNKPIIGRILTPGIRVMHITNPALGAPRVIGSPARDGLVSANAAAAFPR